MNNTQYKLPDHGLRAPIFGADDGPSPDRARRNGVIAIIVVAFLLAGIWDYRNQQNEISAIEDRVERIGGLLARPRQDTDSLRALRGLLTHAQDDSAVISSRWIASRQQALWTNIDRVDKRLRPLEQRFGIVSQ